MSVARWQKEVLEEQEVRTLVVAGIAVSHTDSEENILSYSVLIIKVPQTIISEYP